MSKLLNEAQQRIRTVEMSFIVCCASLDIHGWCLTHKPVLDVLAMTMGLDPEDPEMWKEIKMKVPGSPIELHQPVPTDVLLPHSGRNEFYAFIYFSALRDLAMVTKVYLRSTISQHYLDAPTSDESWFSSWTDFLLYTNIDISSVPEAKGMAELFDIDDQLFLRDMRTDKTKVMGTALFFQYCQTVRDFLGVVDQMVAHDIFKKKGKTI